jgi:hypothetical protein
VQKRRGQRDTAVSVDIEQALLSIDECGRAVGVPRAGMNAKENDSFGHYVPESEKCKKCIAPWDLTPRFNTEACDGDA